MKGKNGMKTKRAKDLYKETYGNNIQPAIAALVEFAAQNSGIDARNYFSDWHDTNGIRAYRQECRDISADWKRFRAALAMAAAEGVKDSDVIRESRTAFSGRLLWCPKQHHDAKTGVYSGQWNYTTGQYFPTEYRKAAATVLEYAIQSIRRARPPQKKQVTTISQLKALNEKNGGCWFGKGEMAFFGTKIESGIIRGKYFITSEQPPHGPRKFSVRSFDNEGNIDTEGEFCAYDTKDDAIAAIPKA